MRPQVTIAEDIGAVAGEVVARAIVEVTAERGQCRLALSGGSSPGPVMEWLAEHLRPAVLKSLVVTWVDERHLPILPGDDWRVLPEASNLRLAWEHWFRRVPTPPAIVPMARPGSLEHAVSAYVADFTDQLGGLDVVLLGAGSDGHIASLFPDHAALEATGICVAVEDSPKPPPQRLTLTLPILEDVDHAILVARGAGKASMLRQAHAGVRSLPLGRYRPRGSWRWVLDPAVAAHLPQRQDES